MIALSAGVAAASVRRTAKAPPETLRSIIRVEIGYPPVSTVLQNSCNFVASPGTLSTTN